MAVIKRTEIQRDDKSLVVETTNDSTENGYPIRVTLDNRTIEVRKDEWNRIVEVTVGTDL